MPTILSRGISLIAFLALAEINACSIANRLPPPWAGIGVVVPQPVSMLEAMTRITRLVNKVIFLFYINLNNTYSITP